MGYYRLKFIPKLYLKSYLCVYIYIFKSNKPKSSTFQKPFISFLNFQNMHTFTLAPANR
jgi:hypothetical protein